MTCGNTIDHAPRTRLAAERRSGTASDGTGRKPAPPGAGRTGTDRSPGPGEHPRLSRGNHLRHNVVVKFDERVPVHRFQGAPAPASDVCCEKPTRERLRREILERGPVTARQLSDGLGLTCTAVRRHLDTLLAQDHIAEWKSTGPRRRGRGRPARRFVITDAGHDAMATGYGHLASAALQFLQQHLGPDAVLAFARTRVAELERRYLPIVDAAGPEPALRAGALALALDADGYAASIRPLGLGKIPAVQLCQGHCPVHHVARRFPELCEAETEAFSRLLGVHVRRLATLAHGEHVCTTHVPDRDGAPAVFGAPTGPGTSPADPRGPEPPGSVASGTAPNSADPEETNPR